MDCKCEYEKNNNYKRTLYIEEKYKIYRDTFKEIKCDKPENPTTQEFAQMTKTASLNV